MREHRSTLFTANQPMPATIELTPAGSALPKKPNALRLITICGRPLRGPQDERVPCVALPSAVPSTIAQNACQNDSPNASVPRMPTPTVANSMFGEVQVHSSCSGRPCRSSSGMNPVPPGSTAAMRSP